MDDGEEGLVRLQKYMAQAGVASRRKSETLISAGRVTVNGRVVRELGTKIDPLRDRVSVEGQPIKAERKVHYALNKPEGIVCSSEGPTDERGRPTVLSLMHGVRERVYPVGRLDFNSRGLIILTNDGDLSALLTHPRNAIVKTYHVKFQGKLDDSAMKALREGVTLEDGTLTRPAVELFIVRETAANTWVQLAIAQGLNRQIRRMGDAIGHAVLKLIRVSIGDLTTDGIEEGSFRPLSRQDLERLRAYEADR